MAELIADSTDFAEYMSSTDSAHKVRPASSFADDVVKYFHDPSGPSGDMMPWRKTHDLIRFRPGEVTLWSGMNGHGKSLALGQVTLGLAAQQRKVCIASMEMKPAITLARMCRQQFAGKPSIDDIASFHTATDGLLYLYDQQGTVKAPKMLAVMRYCAERKVDHFVLDSLLKCGIAEDGYNQQKDFVDQITAVARDTGMHVHIVAHSRKGNNELEQPGKVDVRGSSAITDQVDNVITTWRNKLKERDREEGKSGRERDPDTLLICDKQRNGEWEGRIALWFDQTSTQFVETGLGAPIDLLGIATASRGL